MLAANVGACGSAAPTCHALLSSSAPFACPGHGATTALSSTSSTDARLVGQLSWSIVPKRIPNAFTARIRALSFATVQKTEVTHIAIHVLTCP